MHKPQHIETAEREMIAVLRSKSPTERLAIAHDMWAHAQKQIHAILRAENPDWSAAEIRREVARRLSHGAV